MSTSVLVSIVVLFTIAMAALVAFVVGMIDVEKWREDEMNRRREERS